MRSKLPILIIILGVVSAVQTITAETVQDETALKSEGGSISGKLLRSNGRPRPYTELELVPLGDEEKSSDMRLWAISDMRGVFAFKDIPNGKYTLSINFNEAPSETSPFSTFYFPNTANRDEARIFEITDGIIFNRLNFRLPPDLATKFITGKVLRENGEPVKDAYISLVDMEFNDHISFGNIKTDAKGEFRVRAYIGREYGIVAILFDTPTLDIYSEVTARGQSDVFKLDEEFKPLEIVIKEFAVKKPQEPQDKRIIGGIGF